MRTDWLRACVVAEAIGMTAAAAAARFGTWLSDFHSAPAGWALAVVVGGGLVEGGALGWLQARVLSPAVGTVPARRWALVTLAVAGVGWAAASAPATLSSSDDGSTPPVAVVLAGAAALGAAMGAVLGAAQSWTVRDATRRPWRWTGRSTVGWTAAMPVIFLGASAPGAHWPTPLVVLLGTITGCAAGAALGGVTAGAAQSVVREAYRPGAEGPIGSGSPAVGSRAG